MKYLILLLLAATTAQGASISDRTELTTAKEADLMLINDSDASASTPFKKIYPQNLTPQVGLYAYFNIDEDTFVAKADNTGTSSNALSLVADGTSTFTQLITAFNIANPSTTFTVIDGGAGIPSAATYTSGAGGYGRILQGHTLTETGSTAFGAYSADSTYFSFNGIATNANTAPNQPGMFLIAQDFSIYNNIHLELENGINASHFSTVSQRNSTMSLTDTETKLEWTNLNDNEQWMIKLSDAGVEFDFDSDGSYTFPIVAPTEIGQVQAVTNAYTGAMGWVAGMTATDDGITCDSTHTGHFKYQEVISGTPTMSHADLSVCLRTGASTYAYKVVETNIW